MHVQVSPNGEFVDIQGIDRHVASEMAVALRNVESLTPGVRALMLVMDLKLLDSAQPPQVSNRSIELRSGEDGYIVVRSARRKNEALGQHLADDLNPNIVKGQD